MPLVRAVLTCFADCDRTLKKYESFNRCMKQREMDEISVQNWIDFVEGCNAVHQHSKSKGSKSRGCSMVSAHKINFN